MKEKDKKILAGVIGFITITLSLMFLNSKTIFTCLILLLIGLILLCYTFTNSNKNNNIKLENQKKETTKTCKYCKTEIKVDATVCPHCRKTLNFSFGRVLIGVFIGLIILYLVFIANNDAPLEVRKVVCGLGLRDDYPYCYYVDTDKLNETRNNNH